MDITDLGRHSVDLDTIIDRIDTIDLGGYAIDLDILPMSCIY